MNRPNKQSAIKVMIEAVVIAVICSAAAVIVNAARPGGIPFIPKKQYEIFVPCPEPIGDVTPMSPAELPEADTGRDVLIVDARVEEAYEEWRAPGAINVPFDYLMPVCTGRLKEIAGSGAKKVIVYGDGEDPDSGRELGRELSGKGIRNVYFVEGGAPALKNQTSEAPQ